MKPERQTAIVGSQMKRRGVAQRFIYLVQCLATASWFYDNAGVLFPQTVDW